MKFLYIIIAVFSLTAFSQSYNEDKAEIYTANNQVEETLNTANNILCIISKINLCFNKSMVRVNRRRSQR